MPRNMTKEQYNEHMRVYMLDRYTKRRADALTLLGGACAHCGSTEALDFHHKDPSTKLFRIARGSSFSKARWDAEIAKCELLCSSCHKQEHASLS